MICWWITDRSPAYGHLSRAYAVCSHLTDYVVVAKYEKAAFLMSHGIKATTDLPARCDTLVIDPIPLMYEEEPKSDHRVLLRPITCDPGLWHTFEEIYNVEPIGDGIGTDLYPILATDEPLTKGTAPRILDVRSYQRMDLFPLVAHLHKVDTLIANCGRAVQECRYTGTDLVPYSRNWTEERRAELEGVTLGEINHFDVDKANKVLELASLVGENKPT